MPLCAPWLGLTDLIANATVTSLRIRMRACAVTCLFADCIRLN